MPRKTFDHKKTLITGAASGIGRATAQAAARAGAELFLTDVDAHLLATTAEGIRGTGGRVALAQPADVSSLDAVRALATAIHRGHGSLDIVMNVAGIATWGTVQELEHRHWQRVIDVNLMGPIHVLETFLPPMIAAGRGGHVVNVSSAAGLFGLPWHAAYSASKFGLRGISEVLRFDLARYGIGVTLVCPGAVATPLVETIDIVGLDRANPAVQREVRRFQRRAVTAEVAAAAIIRGVERDRYLVFTSPDIRLLHWVQRTWELPYRLVMRALNDHLHAIRTRLGSPGG